MINGILGCGPRVRRVRRVQRVQRVQRVRRYERRVIAALSTAMAMAASACAGATDAPSGPLSNRTSPPVVLAHISTLYPATALVSGAMFTYGLQVVHPSLGQVAVQSMTWVSSHPNVANIEYNGVGFANVRAQAPGSAVIRAFTTGTDTLTISITVYPRPATSTPLASAPVTVSRFRVMPIRFSNAVLLTPVAEVYPRAASELQVLEASFDVARGSSAHSCASMRRLGQGGQLFNQYYPGDWDLTLAVPSASVLLGIPVLHLIVLDAEQQTFRLDVPGELVIEDDNFDPTSRSFADDWTYWTCFLPPM